MAESRWVEATFDGTGLVFVELTAQLPGTTAYVAMGPYDGRGTPIEALCLLSGSNALPMDAVLRAVEHRYPGAQTLATGPGATWWLGRVWMPAELLWVEGVRHLLPFERLVGPVRLCVVGSRVTVWAHPRPGMTFDSLLPALAAALERDGAAEGRLRVLAANEPLPWAPLVACSEAAGVELPGHAEKPTDARLKRPHVA